MTLPSYHRYDYISPQALYALVKEEFKSYIESGSLDDTLFSLWTEKVLEKLGVGAYPIATVFLGLNQGEARLPQGFQKEREVWLLTEHQDLYAAPGATYSYVLDTSIRIDSPDVSCDVCTECTSPPLIQAVYKTTHRVFRQYSCERKLSRGIILPKKHGEHVHHSPHIFDIHDGKLVTHLQEGTLTLIFYQEQRDKEGFRLIPDDVWIEEAIEYFIRFKLYDQLFNQTSDESFKQSQIKRDQAKAEYEDKFIQAGVWMRKETAEKKKEALRRQHSRLNRYKL